MTTATISHRDRREAQEEALYLACQLAHVNERLVALKPGINCTAKHYRQLQSERISLTLRVNKAKVKSKGYAFAEETDSVFVYHNVVLTLGGTYKQRVGA